jgi:uncharacterized membrane protein YgcG
MATGPDLRIGDADREAAAASLREHYAVGRLTLEEFNQRLDAVFHASTQSQLRQITRDLPHAPAPSAPLPVTGVGRERARQDYQSGCGAHGHRARLGLLPVIIAAFCAWLVIFDLQLRAFPWPGKLAIFLAVFALIRRLVWRVFAATRGRGGGGYPRGRGYPRRRGGGGRYSGGSWPGGV